MTPKVSVIIPVYNVAKYIEHCARSLFEQTLKDIEYIFVDDCTCDESIEIVKRTLDDYPSRREQVHIIRHDVNKGLPIARNTGLEIAQGKYIAHCDSDDWMEADYYESLLNEGIRTGADIVWSDFFMEFKSAQKYHKMLAPTDNKLSLLQAYISFGWNVVWNMLAKRELYINNNVRSYDKYTFTEDYGLVVRLLYYANKVAYVEKAFYHYNRTNQNSIVNNELNANRRKKMISDEISICLLINDFYKEKGLYDKLQKELAWRLLKAKRGWLFDLSMRNDYLALYPESNNYIDSNIFCSRKDKLCQKLVLKPYGVFFLKIINIIDTVHGYICH